MADEPMHGLSPAAQPTVPHTGRRAARLTLAIIAFIAAALVVAGFATLDPQLYEYSETLNRPGPADPTDFYHRTAWFWDLARGPAHWAAAVAAAGALALFHSRGPRLALAVVVSYFAAASIASVGQASIGRLRPNQAKVATAETGTPYHLKFEGPVLNWTTRRPYCFPSGEATASFALGAALSLALPRWTALWIFAAVLTCTARLIGGAHYLSDVSAGAVLGILCAWLAFAAIDRRRSPNPHPPADATRI